MATGAGLIVMPSGPRLRESRRRTGHGKSL